MNKKRKPRTLNEFLIDEEDTIDFSELYTDDDIETSVDVEWALAMADLEELVFTDEVE